MATKEEENDARSTAVRAMAQHVVLLALVRLHPEPQALRDLTDNSRKRQEQIFWPRPFQMSKFKSSIELSLYF
jgi:hypothetical protein